MKTGMSTSCFFGREILEDSIPIMAKMGAERAEIFLNTFSEYQHDYISALKKRIDDNGISVNSVHPHGVQYEPQMFSKYERSRTDAEDIFKRVLEAARELGADKYVFHGPISLKKNGKKPNMDRNAETVDRLCDISASFGVKFCYENVHWCLFKEPEFAVELLKRTANPNLYFTLDVKQAAQSRRSICDYISAMSGRIANLHICDYVCKEEYVEPRMPFDGELDVKKLRDALKDYKGTAILEVYDDYRDYGELKAIYDSFVTAMS